MSYKNDLKALIKNFNKTASADEKILYGNLNIKELEQVVAGIKNVSVADVKKEYKPTKPKKERQQTTRDPVKELARKTGLDVENVKKEIEEKKIDTTGLNKIKLENPKRKRGIQTRDITPEEEAEEEQRAADVNALKKVYCGTKMKYNRKTQQFENYRLGKDQRLGTAAECAQKNQVRYWGVKKIDQKTFNQQRRSIKLIGNKLYKIKKKIGQLEDYINRNPDNPETGLFKLGVALQAEEMQNLKKNRYEKKKYKELKGLDELEAIRDAFTEALKEEPESKKEEIKENIKEVNKIIKENTNIILYEPKTKQEEEKQQQAEKKINVGIKKFKNAMTKLKIIKYLQKKSVETNNIKPYVWNVPVNRGTSLEGVAKTEEKARKLANKKIQDDYSDFLDIGLTEDNAKLAALLANAMMYDKDDNVVLYNIDSQINRDYYKYGNDYIAKRLKKTKIPTIEDFIDVYLSKRVKEKPEEVKTKRKIKKV